jgi:two-component system OmpR family response regulator
MLVLIVDDEVAIVDLLAELLTDEGYQVHTAYDGRSALSLLRNGLRPAVIISDIMMPGLDGWGLYQAVRGELGLHKPGIILMSAGRARPVELSDSRATFINKPFSVYEILDALTRIVSS